KNQIVSARQFAQEEQEAVQQVQAPKAGPRKVVVNNNTTQYVNVVINGYVQMRPLGPGQSQVYAIEPIWKPTVLTAYSNYDITQWGPQHIRGTHDTYTWNLH